MTTFRDSNSLPQRLVTHRANNSPKRRASGARIGRTPSGWMPAHGQKRGGDAFLVLVRVRVRVRVIVRVRVRVRVSVSVRVSVRVRVRVRV